MTDLYNCLCAECGTVFLSDTLKTVCAVCIPDKKELFNLRAENERLRAALDLYREAVRIDVTMGGPRFMGSNVSALKRAWDADNAALGDMGRQPGEWTGEGP